MNWSTPDDYTDVFEHLQRAEVQYVVVSGVAVVLHGHLRSIADLDIVISSQPEEADRAMHALLLAGFAPSIPLPLSLVSVMRMFDSEEREVDVFVRYYVPFNELWEASEQVRVGEQLARVISLSHLIRVKQTLARPHDLEDVEHLLALAS
ncbi:MAG: hypothetical protein AABN95_16545 [Acidobacteriota bacterium]